MVTDISQVVLGTVQFGLDYGVSNSEGKTHKNDAHKILSRAYELGIRELDTAPSYGDAESIIIDGRVDGYKINTKLLPGDNYCSVDVSKKINESILNFGGNVNSVAFHSIIDLISKDYPVLIDELKHLRDLGRINKIGVSIYNEEDLLLLNNKLTPDFIQLPFNIYDQRFKSNTLINKLREEGCEIHVRSVFLQGLLLMEEADIPNGLKSVISYHNRIHDFEKISKMSIYKMCLSWVMNQAWVDKIVVGVNDIAQLEILVASINEVINDKSVIDLSEFSIDDSSIINPVNWS